MNKDAEKSLSKQRLLHKGQQTKAAIVEAALGLATQIGLEGLSIGVFLPILAHAKNYKYR